MMMMMEGSRRPPVAGRRARKLVVLVAWAYHCCGLMEPKHQHHRGGRLSEAWQSRRVKDGRRWRAVEHPLRGGYSREPHGYDDMSYYGLDDGWTSDAYVDGYSQEYQEQPNSRRQQGGLDLSSLPLPDRKTGVIMCAAGAAFSMLGVSLFFEKNLIRLGNILLVLGAPIVVGPKRVSGYLADPSKLRGSLIFALGFFLILSGHPLLGTIIEVFGFCNLFGNLFPLLGAMLSRLPVINSLAGFSDDRGRAPRDAPSVDPRDFAPY